MSFKFYLNESKIYDFLGFPQLIYVRRSLEDYKDNNYAEMVQDRYIDMAKKVEDLLLPYKGEIETFYMKEISFIELAIRWESIFEYKDINGYLNMLLELDEHQIIQNMIYSFIMSLDILEDPGEVDKEVEKISKDKDSTLRFIKDLPIDSGEKWNLFLFMENPLEYINKYVELMKKLLPIFEGVYREYIKEVEEYGEKLIDTLNNNGPQYLKEITNSMLTINIIDKNERNFLISVFAPYTVRIVSQSKKPFIVWGIDIESVFKRIKEINENKLNERVQIFKNLGDKTRYEVLKLIASGEISTKEIAETLGVTSATISYHLNNLVTSKIIKIGKSDSKYGYIIDYRLLEEILNDFKEDLRFPRENIK